MAAPNYTPIQLYFSTTASAVPLAANLAQGELAINITDGKLYYEDNGGVVQVIATKGAGTIGGSNTQIQYNNAGALAGNAAMTFNSGTSTTTLTTLNLTNALGAVYGGTAQSTYTQGDVLYASASNTLAKLGIGTVNYILTSSGSVPQWSAPSSISVLTATNLAGGLGGSVPYQSAVDTTTFLAIGAANRVMTSTGTAPQWVTSLTSLTGVSSSSITNTSLTSGRVVYSGASGVETDSASLTFNGTTLSAGGFSTTGLSTLVQTVKIGDSNFSGSAAFTNTTPAKLYIGTGTVTDITTAIGGNVTTGAISSLAITPIAASNTGVIYTNASTLYIAGAPSAVAPLAITNAYALYVAAGAAYFGGAVTFAGSASLAGLTVTSLTDSGLTSGRVTFASTGGLLADSANLTWNGTSLSVTGELGATGVVSGSNFNGGIAGFSVGAGADGYQTGLQIFGSGGGGSAYRVNTLANNVTVTTVTSTGLGISETTPTAKLHIGVATAAVNGTKGVRIVNPAGTIVMLECGSGGDSFVGTESGSTFNIRTNNAINATFLTSGNVGFGETNPTQKIHFKGSSTTYALAETTGTGTSSGFRMKAGAGTDFTLYTTEGGNQFGIYNNTTSTQPITIDANNSLGLNTNSPSTGRFTDATTAFLAQSTGMSTGTNIFASNSTNAKFIGLWSGHSGANSAIGVKSGTDFTFGAWTAITGVGGFTEWARLNSAGNYSVGGFTANAWATGYRAINVFSPNSLGLAGSDYGSQVTNNCFASTSGWERVGTSYGAGRYEQFNGYHAFYGDDAGAAGVFTPTQRMTLVSSGQLQFPATVFGTAQISNTYATSMANGATVDFSSFSGMIIVSNWTLGSVGLWITGGGVVVLVDSVGSNFGAVTFVPGIDGYRFTNNTGSTLTFSFTAIRYRANG